jgi:hypothetical protein
MLQILPIRLAQTPPLPPPLTTAELSVGKVCILNPKTLNPTGGMLYIGSQYWHITAPQPLTTVELPVGSVGTLKPTISCPIT